MQPWDLAGAFQGAELNRQKIDMGDVDAAGQAAAGRALMSMVPGVQPIPQANPSAMGMPQNLLQRLQSLFRPQMGGGAPPPQGTPMQVPMLGAQPMAGSMPMQAPQMGVPGGGMPQGMPAGGGGPAPGGAAPSQPGMQPLGGGALGPSLSWQSVVQQVVKANPGVQDPRAIAAAVDRFMPIMNQQSQMEWRAIALNIRQQQADTQRERADTAATQGDKRIEQGDRRLGLAEQRADTAATQGDRRLGLAEQREGRLAAGAKVREDQRYQQLEMQRKALEARITQGKERQLLGQWRALIDAQHKRAQEIIQSGSAGGMPMDPAERKKLLDDEDQRYEIEIQNMKNNMQGRQNFNSRFAPDGGQPAEQGPKPGTVEGGYRFKGGDPADSKNWEPAS